MSLLTREQKDIIYNTLIDENTNGIKGEVFDPKSLFEYICVMVKNLRSKSVLQDKLNEFIKPELSDKIVKIIYNEATKTGNDNPNYIHQNISPKPNNDDTLQYDEDSDIFRNRKEKTLVNYTNVKNKKVLFEYNDDNTDDDLADPYHTNRNLRDRSHLKSRQQPLYNPRNRHLPGKPTRLQPHTKRKRIIRQCYYGDDCTNRYCQYSHPIKHRDHPYQNVEICKYHPNCMRVGCFYSHPKIPNVICRNGPICSQPNCPFSHHEPSDYDDKDKASTNIMCKYNRHCTKPQCPFKHTLHTDGDDLSQKPDTYI